MSASSYVPLCATKADADAEAAVGTLGASAGLVVAGWPFPPPHPLRTAMTMDTAHAARQRVVDLFISGLPCEHGVSEKRATAHTVFAQLVEVVDIAASNAAAARAACRFESGAGHQGSIASSYPTWGELVGVGDDTETLQSAAFCLIAGCAGFCFSRRRAFSPARPPPPPDRPHPAGTNAGCASVPPGEAVCPR